VSTAKSRVTVPVTAEAPSRHFGVGLENFKGLIFLRRVYQRYFDYDWNVTTGMRRRG